MKIRKLIPGIMFLAMLFASCENGENNTLPPKPVEKECYVGTLTVDQNDGTFYTQEDVKIDYEIIDGKLNFVSAAGKDAVANGAHAGKLLSEVSAVTGGKGGGRPDSAMSGGRDLDKIDEALKRAEEILASI